MSDLSKVIDTDCRDFWCASLLDVSRHREGEGLSFVGYLRQAQRIVSVAVIAAFTFVCVISATGPSTLHTTQWSSHPTTREMTTPYQRMAQTAHPAMTRSSYERATLRSINAVRRAH